MQTSAPNTNLVPASLKAEVLSEALPYIQRFHGKTIVIKYGGSALDAASTDTILEDAAALQSVGVRVILVHGGGKEISALLERLQVETHFENGYRVTDQTVLETAEMALSARVNKSIVPSTATPTTPPGRWPRRWGRTSSSSSRTPMEFSWTATTSPPASPKWM